MSRLYEQRESVLHVNSRDDTTSTRRVILFLCLANSLLAQATPASPPARVEPGLEYIHQRIGETPWSIHVAKVDRSRSQFQLTATLAHDHIYGLASVTEQIEGIAEARGKAVAAVNGDFFVIRPGRYQGDPIGLQVVQGELISSPTGVSFWTDKNAHPHIGQVQAKFRAKGPDGLNITFGLNERRADDAAVLYTPAIGKSTRTAAGVEWVLDREGDSPWLPLRPGESYRGRILAVDQQGDTHLTPDIMVLSIGPELAQRLPPLATGTVISLHLETSPDLTGAATALGGGPILLENGVSPDWKGALPRHPRTALGWNEEWFFLVVVDGRQKQLSMGMNYPELSAFVKRLGCTYAMNLDGGGSSTLWLGGQVMNSPSDGRERRVANGLIVVSTEQHENPAVRGDDDVKGH